MSKVMMDDKRQFFNIGDTVYRLSKQGIVSVTIHDIKHYPHCVYEIYCNKQKTHFFNRAIGETIFLTYEEAVEGLQTKENISKKRQLLKEYENQLNEEFGLVDHFIIK